MDRESKGEKIRTSSSKEHRAKSRGKPRLQSANSQPKSIQQMIKQNDQKFAYLNNRRNCLLEELENFQLKQIQTQSQFKEKAISGIKKQINIIQEGLKTAAINGQKLTIMWMAGLDISNEILELQQQIKKKTKKKKQNIVYKSKEFASEDTEQV